jgi:rhodanese-related sulfurtransferase
MKRYKTILFSSLTAFILLPVMVIAAEKAEYPPQVKEMVLEARKHIKTIDMDGFRKVVDNPKGALIVDVREPSEFAAGHVPGAISVPRGVIEFKIWKHIGFPDNTNYDKEIYLYCKTGGRCTLAAKSLQDLGLTNLTTAVVKMLDWQKAGHPLVK